MSTSAKKKTNLLNVASAILTEASSKSLNIVVLNKVLFYADLVALRDHGQTLTLNTYVALENGPVVAKYPDRLVRGLTEAGIAHQEERWDGAKPMVLDAPQEPMPFLTRSMDVIRMVTKHFEHVSSGRVSDFSHKNVGWRIAWDQGRSQGVPKPINLMIALQQIAGEDPWMHEPITEGESDAVFQAADDGIGEVW